MRVAFSRTRTTPETTKGGNATVECAYRGTCAYRGACVRSGPCTYRGTCAYKTLNYCEAESAERSKEATA